MDIFDWKPTSSELAYRAALIAKYLEIVAQKEIEQRKKYGSDWVLSKDADLLLSELKLNLAKIEHNIKNNNKVQAIENHEKLVGNFRQIVAEIIGEPLCSKDLEDKKNILVKKMQEHNIVARKHYLEMLFE